ncbi:MAG: signal peptidase II [Phyllobacteriaceae bacterium]|nr:signal peptidase II [Phyllobacteriaceae bacterium]
MRVVLGHAALTAALIAADQAIKLLVEAHLPFEHAIPMMPMLSLYRTWNPGISFTLLAGLGPTALIALAAAVTGFVLYLAARTRDGEIAARLGYATIVAGALGNLIDRVAYGHVVDYLLFHTQNWSFSVFNLADVCISVGAAMVVLQEALNLRRARQASSGD